MKTVNNKTLFEKILTRDEFIKHSINYNTGNNNDKN